MLRATGPGVRTYFNQKEIKYIPAGGTPLFGLYGYLPLNRVWLSRSWVLKRVYNFIIKPIEQGLFWTGSLSKSVKTCDERSTFAIPILFFLKFYFLDFSVKNYLILYAKQNKSGSEGSVSCQGSKMSNFCFEQGRGLRKRLWHSST